MNKGQKIVEFSKAYQSNRIKLMEAIPLELPLCIIIEPTNICNFKCLMCWQSTDEYKKDGGPFINMDMDLFNKTIDDIKAFCIKKNGKIKLMKLYSTGEPLLHKNIIEMMQIIKRADICDQLEVTTNGSMLTPEIAKTMVDVGLDYLRISIYSVTTDGQKRVTKSNVLPETIRDNVKYVFDYRNSLGKSKPFICAKIIDTHTEENELFREMYKNISDEQIVETPWSIPKLEVNALEKLYDGKEDGQEADAKYRAEVMYKARKACRYPFTHLTVRSNGDAVVCCTDWSRDTCVGNVKNNSIEEIWDSKSLYKFRVMMLTTKGINHPICASCELPLKDCAEDDIDNVDIKRLNFKYDC